MHRTSAAPSPSSSALIPFFVPENSCPTCGYALSGLVRNELARCPECGSSIHWRVEFAREAAQFRLRSLSFYGAVALAIIPLALGYLSRNLDLSGVVFLACLAGSTSLFFVSVRVGDTEPNHRSIPRDLVAAVALSVACYFVVYGMAAVAAAVAMVAQR